jgi:hypothetical protein
MSKHKFYSQDAAKVNSLKSKFNGKLISSVQMTVKEKAMTDGKEVPEEKGTYYGVEWDE